MYLVNLSVGLTWVHHVKGHVCLASLMFSQVNFFFLQISCKILFLLVCLVSFSIFFVPAHSVLPTPSFPLAFLDCVSSETQVLGNFSSNLSVLLFLIKLPWSACQVLKSCRLVSAKEAASFGKTDITALGSVSWPAAGVLLLSVCCIAKLTICGPNWAGQIAGKLGTDIWSEQPPYLPQAVLSSSVNQSSC